jgi:predicted metal-binding membrane protein
MAGMTGTMGLGLALFVPVWTLMMAAMKLPSVDTHGVAVRQDRAE